MILLPWAADVRIRMSLLRHFHRLSNMRDQLENKLDLDDAGLSGSIGLDYRARRDLRDRISEITNEMCMLERRPDWFQS